MKISRFFSVSLLILLASCATVRVNSDYDKNVDFTQFKTYAFYKTGIDKVEISDLDKKRILHSIDEAMMAKGLTKSDTPDLLININTKAQTNVNVNDFYAGYGYGWRYGWNPYLGYGTSVYTSTEGILTIDLIDATKKELVWQGEGIGELTKNTNKKDENIKDFVSKILTLYPPAVQSKK